MNNFYLAGWPPLGSLWGRRVAKGRQRGRGSWGIRTGGRQKVGPVSKVRYVKRELEAL